MHKALTGGGGRPSNVHVAEPTIVQQVASVGLF